MVWVSPGPSEHLPYRTRVSSEICVGCHQVPMGYEKDERSLRRALLRPISLLLILVCSLAALRCPAQLFTNLQSLVHQIPVNNLATVFDGPKGIGSADFDGDGRADIAVSNTDGSVTVFFGLGQGRF